MLAAGPTPTPFNLRPLPNPLDVVPAAGTAQPGLPQPMVTATGPDQRYVVLGSFASWFNAHDMVRLHAPYGPVAVVVKVKGHRYHRVVVGPFAKAELAGVRRALRAAGIRNPWTIRGCADGAPETPNCISVWPERAELRPGNDLAAVPTAVN
jgi:cell division protein FtsN